MSSSADDRTKRGGTHFMNHMFGYFVPQHRDTLLGAHVLAVWSISTRDGILRPVARQIFSQPFDIIHQALGNRDCLCYLGILLLACGIDGLAQYRAAEVSCDDHGFEKMRKASSKPGDLLLGDLLSIEDDCDLANWLLNIDRRESTSVTREGVSDSTRQMD
ncbi:hypothetical protein ACHAQJ_006067 [Trichoderma viride]